MDNVIPPTSLETNNGASTIPGVREYVLVMTTIGLLVTVTDVGVGVLMSNVELVALETKIEALTAVTTSEFTEVSVLAVPKTNHHNGDVIGW